MEVRGAVRPRRQNRAAAAGPRGGGGRAQEPQLTATYVKIGVTIFGCSLPMRRRLFDLELAADQL